MIDVTNEAYWDAKFEEKREHKKVSFEDKIIMIGLIIFGMCTLINTALIYAFFNLLGKV